MDTDIKRDLRILAEGKIYESAMECGCQKKLM